MEESNIQEFYKSRNVFITGGTGFMGKLLIEKLLRSTELSTIYVLIREKKGKNAHSRIDELFDDVIFDTLKRECPKFKHRIEAIPGDCSVSGLGISITDRQKLMSDIHVVFHVAATVKFDENLKLAYSINVQGTKGVLDLARQMKNLKSIIHVSTAFSNCHLHEIEEKFYDCPYTYEDIGQVLEKLNKNEIEQLTPRIIGPWPNTYTFTKALAESMIKQTGSGLPLGIFRPAIVISTYKEPIDGWIDNLYGPTGTCAGTFTGVIRVIMCDVANTPDMVPADTCVAGLIAASYAVANKEYERTVDNIPIYNYVSSPENPITWNEFIQLNIIHGYNYPVLNSLWAITLIITSNLRNYKILRLLLHTLPALAIDAGAVVTGNKPSLILLSVLLRRPPDRKPCTAAFKQAEEEATGVTLKCFRMLQLYKKIHNITDILLYFSSRSWKFSNKNMVNMWSEMNKTDRELFPFSMTTVHWLLYFRGYIKGMRQYLLKDPDSTLEVARKRGRRLLLLHQAVKVILMFIACNTVSLLCSKMYSLIFK